MAINLTSKRMPDAIWAEVIDSVNDRLENLRDLSEASQDGQFNSDIVKLELALEDLQDPGSVDWEVAWCLIPPSR